MVALAACKGGGDRTGPVPVPSTAVALSGSAAPGPAPVKPGPPRREGSSIARSPTSDALYVADEDHGVVRRIPLPLDVNNPAPAVPMPGQPAQVLALDGRVLVTIRSSGAVPPGAASTAGDAPDPAAPPDSSAAVARPAPAAPSQPRPAGSASAARRFSGRATLVPSATGPGLLLVMRPDADKGLVEIARVELPQDAWGVAITPDASLALVTSAWTHRVSAVDLATYKVRWTVNVPREPRAVVVRPDGHAAYVTHLIGPDLTRIDDLEGEPRVRSIALPASPLRAPPGQRLGASLAYSAVLSPDGRRLFVPRHALGALGPQAWFGAATVDVLLTGDDTPLVPARRDGPRVVAKEAQAMLEDLAGGSFAPRVAPAPFAQPRAVAYLAKKDAVLVLGEGDDAMVTLDARAIDPAMHVISSSTLVQKRDEPIAVARVCGAPSGIALSADEETAWIYCRSTDDLLVWSFGWSGPRPTLHLGDDLLPAEAALGRRIFYNGTDPLTSGGLGCAGCHPEGRDDGHVWHETGAVGSPHPTFVSGGELVASTGKPDDAGFARQTPMLAGRVAVEGPYGWHAESPILTHRLINGFGLHRWNEPERLYQRRELYDRAMALRAYLRKGLVPPPHEERALSEKEKQGRDIFLGERAACAGCHVPATEYTDREAYAVFGALPPPRGFAADPEARYKTPSLRFVGGTPPYLHDGRFATLAALVAGNDDRMGKTSHLTANERDALVAFLETL